MAGSIYSWSTTAASNASSDGDINWNEGQAPSTVNNSARQMQARLAEWVKDQGGGLAAGGTANAITVTANSAFTSYATGQMLAFTALANNGGPTTLSVNVIGAKSIRKFTSAGEEALAGGEIKAGGIFLVMYNATLNSGAGGWVLVNPVLASLTLNSAKIGTADFASYAGTPISGLVPGTTTGALIEGPINGHLVVGIRDNDALDSFSVVSYDGTGAYSRLVAAFRANGDVQVPILNSGTFSLTGASAGKELRGQTLSSSAAIITSAGHERFYNTNGQVGSISTSGTATAFNTSSDGRRKKNLRDFDSGGLLDALEVWLFDWIGGGTGYGVIAQDAQKVFPDAISEGDDGFLQADYSKFVPLLLREVKALRARVAALEAD